METMLSGFFDHEWFTRTWTLQEFLLNERSMFICSGTSIAGRKLAPYVYTLTQAPHGPGEPYISMQGRVLLEQFFRMRYQDLAQVDALRFMTVVKGARTTDPKDKVIGIQAILQKLGIRLPSLDYSMTPEDLCTAFTKAWIMHWEDLYLLNLSRAVTAGTMLPSWIVDLNDSEGERNEVIYNKYTRAAYLQCSDAGFWHMSATRYAKLRKTVFDVDGELASRGKVLTDVRRYVGPSRATHHKPTRNSHDALPMSPERLTLWARTARTIVRWAAFIAQFQQLGNGWTMHMLASVLNAGPAIMLHMEYEKQMPTDMALILDVINDLSIDDVSLANLVERSGVAKLKLWTALEHRVDTETLFSTADGRLGILYTQSMENADVIALVEGSDFPLVLRTCQGQPHKFRYIGPAILSSASSNLVAKAKEKYNDNWRERLADLRPVPRGKVDGIGKFRYNFHMAECTISSTMCGHEWPSNPDSEGLQDIVLI